MLCQNLAKLCADSETLPKARILAAKSQEMENMLKLGIFATEELCKLESFPKRTIVRIGKFSKPDSIAAYLQIWKLFQK